MSDLTFSDLVNASKVGGNCEGFGGGSWIWIILIFLFIGFGNGNGFGGNNQATAAADVAAAEAVYNKGFQAAEGLSRGIDTTYKTAFETQKEILQNRFDNLLGQRDLLASQKECCCATQKLIIEENSKTRALITDNKIANLEREILSKDIQLSNQAQSSALLDRLQVSFTPSIPLISPVFSGVNPFGTSTTVIGNNDTVSTL